MERDPAKRDERYEIAPAGPKWDGTEMGRDQNGMGPKWDGPEMALARIRNNGPEMGRAQNGTGMKWDS